MGGCIFFLKLVGLYPEKRSRILVKGVRLNMPRKGKLKDFFKDESGQTMLEYILILAIVVTILMQFRGKFRKVMTNMFDQLENKTDDVWDDDF